MIVSGQPTTHEPLLKSVQLTQSAMKGWKCGQKYVVLAPNGESEAKNWPVLETILSTEVTHIHAQWPKVWLNLASFGSLNWECVQSCRTETEVQCISQAKLSNVSTNVTGSSCHHLLSSHETVNPMIRGFPVNHSAVAISLTVTGSSKGSSEKFW